MSPETALSEWLHTELPRRGFPLGGRKGGIAEFAEHAGLSKATASRTVHGKQTPTLDTLRKIGSLWDISIGDMLVIAGLAEPADLELSRSTTVPQLEAVPDDREWAANPPADLRAGVRWGELSLTLRWLWHTPGLPADMRYQLAGIAKIHEDLVAKNEQMRQGGKFETSDHRTHGQANGA